MMSFQVDHLVRTQIRAYSVVRSVTFSQFVSLRKTVASHVVITQILGVFVVLLPCQLSAFLADAYVAQNFRPGWVFLDIICRTVGPTYNELGCNDISLITT